MTDNEIIKALECLLDRMRAYECENVSTGKGLITSTLDLINRQQAEIEKLEKVEHFATKLVTKQKAEIERLEGRVEATEISKQKLLSCFKTAKSEAIKEVLPKIKAHAYYIDFPKRHRVVDEDDIDNLIKEMAGDAK